jgi:hypothetical protein
MPLAKIPLPIIDVGWCGTPSLAKIDRQYLLALPLDPFFSPTIEYQLFAITTAQTSLYN